MSTNMEAAAAAAVETWGILARAGGILAKAGGVFTKAGGVIAGAGGVIAESIGVPAVSLVTFAGCDEHFWFGLAEHLQVTLI
jgi:hypothetical protein